MLLIYRECTISYYIWLHERRTEGLHRAATGMMARIGLCQNSILFGQWNSISYMDSMHSVYFFGPPQSPKERRWSCTHHWLILVVWAIILAFWYYPKHHPVASLAWHGNPRSIHGGLVRWHFIVEVNWGFPSKVCLIVSPIGSMVLL